MTLDQVAVLLAAVFLAPIAGGLLAGIDRKITARMHGRVGPPIVQPFYDFVKLLGKRGSTTGKFQVVTTWLHLTCTALSLVLVALGFDLIVMLFVLAFGSVAFVLGGFSVKSPYSQIGSQREVMQLLTYEPLLIFMVVGFYLNTGTFTVQGILDLGRPLLPTMPLFFFTMVIVMLVKLRKSPFDIAATPHHGHQEVVRGPMTEISGPSLALVELTHWYELVLLLALMMLLWATNLWIGLAIGLLALFCAILIDNISARMTWSWMLRFGWTFGLALAVVNLAVIYAGRQA